MERFLNFETRQRFQVNLDTGAITVEPSKIVPIPAEEVKTPRQNISKDTDWRGFEGPPPANSFMHNLLKGVFPELPNVEFRFDIASNEDIPSKTSPLSGHTWLQEIEKAIKESWNQEAAEGGMAGNPFRALHERMAAAKLQCPGINPCIIDKLAKAISGASTARNGSTVVFDWNNPSDMAKAFEETRKMERADKLAEEIRATGTDFKPKTMDFSTALCELNRGKKIKRANWITYLRKADKYEGIVVEGVILSCVKEGMADIWDPTQSDIRATNWIVVE